MSCPIGEDLKQKWQIQHQIANRSEAQDRILFPFHRVSTREAKQKKTAAKRKALLAFKAWDDHIDKCQVCKTKQESEGTWKEPL